jgi:hypothetical protein
MEINFSREHQYLRVKKKVKALKGFYAHLEVYFLVNIFISGVVIYGITRGNDSLRDALSNFGVCATWLFWGIGIFFHWFGVFGFKSITSKDWEERKIKEIMKKDKIERKF